MNKRYLYNIKNIVIALAVTLFFQCTNDFNKVQQVGVLQNQPIGIADTINLKYTDSSRLKANLLSPKMLDFSNRDFPYSEFPNGIDLTLYDDDNNKSVITSDYAIYYTETNLIDLRGNVVLRTHKNDTLFTEQLYYNEKLEWVFTNNKFRFKTNNSNLQGNGFDSDVEFKNPQIIEMYDSEIPIDN
jgi:LPS export ABC transporter protein LptC